jgi:hypothetical protein
MTYLSTTHLYAGFENFYPKNKKELPKSRNEQKSESKNGEYDIPSLWNGLICNMRFPLIMMCSWFLTVEE